MAGNVLVEPLRLSPVGLSVTSYATLVSADGDLEIFWGGDGPDVPQLYHAKLNSNGQVVSISTPLEQPGQKPAINMDQEGMIHVVWLDEPEFGEFKVYYAEFSPTEETLGQPAMLSAFPVPLGMVAHRPDVALVGNNAIVFWSLERRGGGMNPPSARSLYVMFPLGHPEAVTAPIELIIPNENRPSYARTESLFGIDELATGQSGSPSTFVYMPAVVQGQQNEGAILFSVQLRGRTKRWIQPIVTVWSEHAYRGYQVATQTRTTSIRNRVARDEQNALYLVWIDTAGFGAYDVYYASTAPGIQQELNRLTGWDVLSGFYDVLWGIAQAAGFFPLAVAWSLASVMIIAAYLFWKAQGRLDHPGARLILIIAIAAYILSKYVFRPNWAAALPLPRYMPELLAALITYLTPLVVSALAALITWFYTHRTERTAILAAFGVFVASDALLTLLIYVPAMLAE